DCLRWPSPAPFRLLRPTRSGPSPTAIRHARATTATVTPASTAWVARRDTAVSAARVPLVRPCSASPITGSTGRPHPATLHGEVARPSVLRTAPAAPPRPPPRHGRDASRARAYAHSAK